MEDHDRWSGRGRPRTVRRASILFKGFLHPGQRASESIQRSRWRRGGRRYAAARCLSGAVLSSAGDPCGLSRTDRDKAAVGVERILRTAVQEQVPADGNFNSIFAAIAWLVYGALYLDGFWLVGCATGCVI